MPPDAERAAPECSICLCAMDTARGISAMSCGHVFCSVCISKAVRFRSVCPVCRNPGAPIRLFIGTISSGTSGEASVTRSGSILDDDHNGADDTLATENAMLSAQLQLANAEVYNKSVLLNAAHEQLTAVSAAFAREKDAQQSLVREVTAKLALAVDTKNKLLQDRITLKAELQHNSVLLRHAEAKLSALETSHAEKMEQFKGATLRLKQELDRLKNIEAEHVALQLRAGELEQQNQSLDLRLRKVQGLPPATDDVDDVVPKVFMQRHQVASFQTVALKPRLGETTNQVEVINLDCDSQDEYRGILESVSVSSGTAIRRPLNAGLGNVTLPSRLPKATLKPSFRKLVAPPPKKQATLRMFSER